jgi:hypothetical protein
MSQKAFIISIVGAIIAILFANLVMNKWAGNKVARQIADETKSMTDAARAKMISTINSYVRRDERNVVPIYRTAAYTSQKKGKYSDL